MLLNIPTHFQTYLSCLKSILFFSTRFAFGLTPFPVFAPGSRSAFLLTSYTINVVSDTRSQLESTFEKGVSQHTFSSKCFDSSGVAGLNSNGLMIFPFPAVTFSDAGSVSFEFYCLSASPQSLHTTTPYILKWYCCADKGVTSHTRKLALACSATTSSPPL